MNFTCSDVTRRACRSKAASLPAQLTQSLAPREKDAAPTFLDFDFVAAAATSQTPAADPRVKMTADDIAADDDDDDDDDDVRPHRQGAVDSASVDIGPTPVHS